MDRTRDDSFPYPTVEPGRIQYEQPEPVEHKGGEPDGPREREER